MKEVDTSSRLLENRLIFLCGGNTMYIMDLRFRAAIRASNKYRKALARFSKAYPSVTESEIHLDAAFENLCSELTSTGVRKLLECVLELHQASVNELELGLDREELDEAVEIELRIARQAGVKNRVSKKVFEEATCAPEQLRLFNDTDALIAALREQHARGKVLITESRKLDRAVKNKMKKNVRQAAASTSFALIMFAGNGLVVQALLPISGAAGFFAVHMAVRDLLE